MEQRRIRAVTRNTIKLTLIINLKTKQMGTFKIEIEETAQLVITVEAETVEEALEQVEDKYRAGDLIVQENNETNYDFKVTDFTKDFEDNQL